MREPRLFRLAAPTGGGKALAGVESALRYTAAQGLERVTVVVPYTSITKRTAG